MTDYAVYGCSSCEHLWIVRRTAADTTACPRCGTRYERDSREPLATAETRAGAAQQRGALLRERWSPK